MLAGPEDITDEEDPSLLPTRATVERLQARLLQGIPSLVCAPPGAGASTLRWQLTEALLAQLAARLERPAATTLRWIRSTVGSTTRLIAVDDIDYLRSEEKYTLIGWRGDDGRPVAAWTYHDESGAPTFHVCRFDHADGGKDVLPLTLWREDGALRWQWKGYQKPRPLYGLDKLAARPDAPWKAPGRHCA